MSVAHIEALTGLLGVIVWPLIVAVVLLFFARPLRKLLLNASELTFKAAGMEATIKRGAEVAASLGAAAARRAGEAAPDAATSERASQEIASTVSHVITPRSLQALERASVLWVDDHPEWNTFERRALEQAGMQVVTAISTEEGVERALAQPFDAIISDMGRPPDERAGYTLLRALRTEGVSSPFIIYSLDGGRAEYRAEARAAGAAGSTGSPQELLQMVARAVQQDART